MLKRWSCDTKVTTADIVDCFIVNQESTITVLNGAVGGKNCVVRLNNSGRNPRSWVDSKFELGLLAVVGGEALEKKRTESRTSSTTERVEDQETLKGRAVVLCKVSVFHPKCLYSIVATHQNATNLIQSAIQDLLSDGVVTSGVIIGSIFLTTDQQLWVEELTVVTSSDLIDRGRVQIDKDGTWDVFSTASLREDSVQLTRSVDLLCVGIWATIL